MENFYENKADALIKLFLKSIKDGKSSEELEAVRAGFIAESYREYRNAGFFAVSAEYFSWALNEAYRSKAGVLFSLSA